MFDFAKSISSKIKHIGGFTLQTNKKHQLEAQTELILSKSIKGSILVSFGSVADPSLMPEEMFNNLKNSFYFFEKIFEESTNLSVAKKILILAARFNLLVKKAKGGITYLCLDDTNPEDEEEHKITRSFDYFVLLFEWAKKKKQDFMLDKKMSSNLIEKIDEIKKICSNEEKTTTNLAKELENYKILVKAKENEIKDISTLSSNRAHIDKINRQWITEKFALDLEKQEQINKTINQKYNESKLSLEKRVEWLNNKLNQGMFDTQQKDVKIANLLNELLEINKLLGLEKKKVEEIQINFEKRIQKTKDDEHSLKSILIKLKGELVLKNEQIKIKRGVKRKYNCKKKT